MIQQKKLAAEKYLNDLLAPTKVGFVTLIENSKGYSLTAQPLILAHEEGGDRHFTTVNLNWRIEDNLNRVRQGVDNPDGEPKELHITFNMELSNETHGGSLDNLIAEQTRIRALVDNPQLASDLADIILKDVH